MTFRLLVVVVSILKLSNQGGGQLEGSYSKSSAIMHDLVSQKKATFYINS